MEPEDNDDLVTGTEVAKHFRVQPSTIRRWVKEGLLKGIFIPARGQKRLLRFKKQEVRTFDPRF